jgi:hypothetical protein
MHLKAAMKRIRIKCGSRRGVATVIAMMFLIIFGSLVAAMAIASTGNIRTAAMHLHVMRAMSAADTGMRVAEERLMEASNRFVVAQSNIDEAYTFALWTGNSGALGDYTILDPASGFNEASTPAGLAEALVNHHNSDLNAITGAGFIDEAVIGSAPAGTDAAIYSLDNWVFTPAVAIENADGNGLPPAFQIRYVPLADGIHIRAIVDGYAFDYGRNNQPIRRTISKDFEIVKRVNHAIISPSRIMIGKNVRVEGDLGISYDDIDFEMGDPLVIRSDFMGLDSILDQKITDFFAGLDAFDVDGDSRLRSGHPIESGGIPGADTDYDSDGQDDNAFADVTGDGYVDEFDIFINHYDADGDGRVTLSAALIAGTPAGNVGATPEFVRPDGTPADDDLALMIDGATPDRNNNGVYGYEDLNGNGYYDPGAEPLLDYDSQAGVYSDLELGYRDGYIDGMDLYAKVHGSLAFKVSASAWETAQGDISPKLRGPISPEEERSPQYYEAPASILPDITADSFSDTETALLAAADGDPFWTQVAAQLGASIAALETWTVGDNPGGTDQPYFIAVWADNDYDGLPDNVADAFFEKSPFNSPSFADYYYRPVFRNFTFRNVVLPVGLNALFENCQFIGVTRVDSYADNTHPFWSTFGLLQMDEALGYPVPVFSRRAWGDDAGEDPAEIIGLPYLPDSARPPEQIAELAENPLDKADIVLSEVILYDPAIYDALKDPLVINGKRVVDTKKYSNNIRFDDCLFVGSIVSQAPQVYTQVRNKLQFTGATKFAQEHPDDPGSAVLNPDPEDLEEIAKSSMMLPSYSVDIGAFNSPPEQDVQLSGAIVAGVLDVRGNARINGSLLLTFKPVYGEGPLMDLNGVPIGNPAGFNTSLGYFGPEDGDYESLDPETLPIVDDVRIVGWDLDGDGFADLGPDETPTLAQIAAGAVTVPWNGYGKIVLSYDPNMTLPEGLMIPLQVSAQVGSYYEGKQ